MAFKIAMSRVFPMTIIIRLLAILNAATRTISARMTNITRRSNFRALNRLRFICIQSRVQ